MYVLKYKGTFKDKSFKNDSLFEQILNSNKRNELTLLFLTMLFNFFKINIHEKLLIWDMTKQIHFIIE